MSRQKILIVCDKNECNSFGRLTLNLVDAVSQEFEPHVLWLKTPKAFPKETSDIPNATVHEAWAKNLFKGYFAFPKALQSVCSEIKPDIVLLICPRLGYLMPAVSSSVPEAQRIVFMHDPFAEKLHPHSLKFWAMNKFFFRHFDMATKFVYNSEWTRRELQDYYKEKVSAKPGTVIGCPIDRSLFFPEANEKALSRKEFWERLGIKGFEQFCLNISIDDPRKNIETFFAMAEARPDVAFIRVGELSKRLKEIISRKKLKNVFHFHSVRAPQLRSLYNNTDLFVYPSFYEGFGLPPIEAIACGANTVCAGTSAIPENMEGICPLVTPADNVNGYLEILDKVKSNETVVDSVAAERILELCSPQKFAERVITALKQKA